MKLYIGGNKMFQIYDEYDNLVISKLIRLIVGVIALVLILIFLNPFTIVKGNERGIRYLFGRPETTVLQPGLHAKTPIVGGIKKFSMVPQKLALNIDIGDLGAISKDNQTIGTRIVVYYKLDESNLYDVATKFSTQLSLENPIYSQINSSIKTIIGTYTIFELAEQQDTIGIDLLKALQKHLSQYPITITQVNVSNFDWSEEFDRQINKTMTAAQKVKQAEQLAKIAEQENKRLIIEQKAKAEALEAEAQGKLNATKLEAEAAIAKAEGEKQAKILEAEGIQRSNQLLAQNLTVELRLRELEIEKIKAERWDGREIPNYIPLTPAGGIVTLPSKQ